MSYSNKKIWIFYEYTISNFPQYKKEAPTETLIASAKHCRSGYYDDTKKRLKCTYNSIQTVFHAEDGTWTHTSAMLTRSLVLLVCQFRHFRISHFRYKFYLLLRQLVLYQKLYKLSIAFLIFFYFFVKTIIFMYFCPFCFP